jgi:hypothetical protein
MKELACPPGQIVATVSKARCILKRHRSSRHIPKQISFLPIQEYRTALPRRRSNVGETASAGRLREATEFQFGCPSRASNRVSCQPIASPTFERQLVAVGGHGRCDLCWEAWWKRLKRSQRATRKHLPVSDILGCLISLEFSRFIVGGCTSSCGARVREYRFKVQSRCSLCGAEPRFLGGVHGFQ